MVRRKRGEGANGGKAAEEREQLPRGNDFPLALFAGKERLKMASRKQQRGSCRLFQHPGCESPLVLLVPIYRGYRVKRHTITLWLFLVSNPLDRRYPG